MATQTEVATHLDLSTRRVRALQRAGVLPGSSGRDGVDLDACRVAYIGYLRETAAGRASADGELDLVEERARLAKEQADAQALKNAELRGEMIPRSDVETGMVALASTVATCLSTLPSKAAPLAHAAASAGEVEAIIRDLVDEARRELAAEGDRLQAEGRRRSGEA